MGRATVILLGVAAMMLAGCRSDLEERAVERSVRLPEDPADVVAIGR